MTVTEDQVDAGLIERIVGEYREMPGLALTLNQARKLWGCDAVTCQCVVEMLLKEGVLRWSSNGRLVISRPRE
ncbi:MAG TPA: hypothetical protein VFS23_03410 [Vicinamibacterales bacterium]|nr:hypothetical protein [Vicinamibacterales bacterium]